MRRSSYPFPLRWPDGVRDASRKRDAQRRFFEASLTAGRPSAFTLLELLVVVAIMGVLLALLLAAVQRMRETAARAQCLNNLRQLALAMHDYHDSQGRFPPGQFLGPYGVGPDSYGWSWLARLLPYLEQMNLYQQGQVPNKTLQASGIAAWQIKLFLCPSDSSSWTGPRTNAGNLYGFAVGKSNYKGVSGANWGSDSSQGTPDINTDWSQPGDQRFLRRPGLRRRPPVSLRLSLWRAPGEPYGRCQQYLHDWRRHPRPQRVLLVAVCQQCLRHLCHSAECQTSGRRRLSRFGLAQHLVLSQPASGRSELRLCGWLGPFPP